MAARRFTVSGGGRDETRTAATDGPPISLAMTIALSVRENCDVYVRDETGAVIATATRTGRVVTVTRAAR